MSDILLRAISADGCYRFAALQGTELVQEALRRHEPGPGPALALARALISATLLSVSEKEFHRIGVQWSGRGPFRSVHVDVRPGGRIRGYVGAPQATASSLVEGLGQGVITVIEQDRKGRFTRGSLPLCGGIDEDLEAWLARSEQVPSRLRVFCDLDEDCLPTSCSGLLVQTLPGGAAEALLGVEGSLAPEVASRELPGSLSPSELLRRSAPRVSIEELSSEGVRFACACSLERVEQGVALLGRDEILDMIARGESARVRCDFCSEDYELTTEGLCRIIDRLDAED